MGETLFSQDPYYKTMPPQMIGALKVKPVLEYLTFSGAPVHLAIETNRNQAVRLQQPGAIVDVKDSDFQLEIPDTKTPLHVGLSVECSFGYKRKRGYFKTSITLIEGRLLTLKMPEEILLTNLRRNPRVTIDRSLHQKHFQVELKAKSGVGPLTVKKVELHEFSQLGMSIFVDRSEALLLPGDRIESLEVLLDGQRVLFTSGVVSRVDMNRKSSTLSNSYELVFLFREQPKSERPTPIDSKRAAKRTPILDSKPCYFTAEHPFFPGRVLEGQVFEISTSGLSCMLDKTPFPIIPGLRFPKAKLQLPHKTQKELVFEIAHVNFKSDGEVNRFKLGGEFVTANVELLKDISAYAQEAADTKISDLREEELDLLWEFLFETNFIYQNKRRQIQNNSREILETYRKLLSKENSVVKKVIFRDQNQIKGHLSAIRFYEHTWLVQHLNALKAEGTSAARGVIQAITDFLYDKSSNVKAGIFYLMSFYRPENLYPSILFGEAARRIGDPMKCSTLEFSFGVYSQGHEETHYEPSSIIQDNADSAQALLNVLVAQGHHSFLRAIGVYDPTFPQSKVKEEFAGLGLIRDRHLLQAEHEGQKVFAIIEVASAGMNLSELTNSIYLFSDSPQSSHTAKLAEALVEAGYQKFFRDRDICPVVLEPIGLSLARNVDWSKIYTCWILAATALPDFERVSNEILADFRNLITSRARPEFSQTKDLAKRG